MEDAELIQQVLKGRHEQYGLLVQRYQEPLIHFLRGILGTEDEVFDCAQEAFLAAYRNLWRYSSSYTFRAWLYAIARNKAIDLMRKKKREIPLSIDENLVDHHVGPEEAYLAKEQALDVQAILEELPEHYRQALYLRYQQELSYEEISTVLNIPISSVKTHLHRGKEKLRQIMERRNGYEGNG
ncbi:MULTISPECIES: RNA polymerase sigma factor [Desulfitobacterium]|uniref:RNA polymerase sigma factor, sigma-70 family n=2 Tax=Desulfitobacterium dehalogenans TaxID=36854 RepID=I4A546_DESDJ|nr:MULTISPECIES: RNA polymerase sigma factor [Desulfitobacterium]AFL99080.1 RNA polymerase sigma factor, sigma-70 family [Desulfitobacterium dehalogenans ATCC 51507]HHY27964.1 RNA polymerase sigma factor [Desulfitobacterium dehalogenans]